MFSESDLPQLQYAPPDRFRRWFGHVVRGMLLALLVVVAILWGPILWRRGNVLYWQWRCLRYAPSTQQVVCSETPFENGVAARFTASAPDPLVLRELLGCDPALAAAVGVQGGPLLFMHERHAPTGQRLLLIVRRVPPPARQSIDCPVLYQGVLIEPATWLQDARVARTWEAAGDSPTPGGDIHFLAGQCDPADASRFEIQCDQEGRKSSIAGAILAHPDEPVPAVEIHAGP